MLGRGAVADPGLAWAIRAHDGVDAEPARPAVGWAELLPLLALYWARIATHTPPRHRSGRLKQWLNLLRRRHPQAQAAFDAVRPLNDPVQVAACLFGDAEPRRGGPAVGGDASNQ
jgi:tRNA-dihydrouridine synthase C